MYTAISLFKVDLIKSRFKVELISHISYNVIVAFASRMWSASIGDKTIIQDHLVYCGPALIDREKKLDFHEETRALIVSSEGALYVILPYDYPQRSAPTFWTHTGP